MKRAAMIVSVFAACSLLIVGCSSTESGTADPSDRASSSSAESSPAGSSASTTASSASTASGETASTAGETASTAGETGAAEGDGATTDDSSSAPDNEGAAVALDAPTVAWFDTFCAGLAPLATLDLSEQVNSGPTDAPDPADPDNALEKQTLVSALTSTGAAFVKTSQALAALQAPTFDGAADFATAAANGLGDAGGQISAAVATFDAVPAGPTDEYWTAKSALKTQALAALAPLQTLAEPPPEVEGGVGQIPSCQALGL